METLKSFLDQSLLIWKDSTAAGRFGIGLLLIMCATGIISVGIWSSQVHYVSLTNNLDPGKANKVMDELAAANIKFKIEGAGGIIKVDQRQLSSAKLIARKNGVDRNSAEQIEAPSWSDPVTQQQIHKLNLEKRLEHSLTRMAPIDSAKVHLTLPEKQPFIRESVAPSAAVILTLSPNSNFNEATASSIAQTVAHSVSGLDIANVSITDTNGVTYSTDSSMGQLTQQEEHRIMRDRELAQKVELFLSNMFGIGNSLVTVTTDFTFTEATETSEEYDNDNKALISEDVTTETTKGSSGAASGPAGTGSNITSDGSTRTPKAGEVFEKETLKNDYKISSLSRIEEIKTPTLNSMTIAVAVDPVEVQDEQGQVPPELLAQVENLVRSAVGFREDKDQISVQFTSFVEIAPLEVPAAMTVPWDKINSILKNISLGVAALVALFIGLKALTKFKPDPANASEVANSSTQVNKLSDLVNQNPEVFSKIIETWSNLETKSDSRDVERRRAG